MLAMLAVAAMGLTAAEVIDLGKGKLDVTTGNLALTVGGKKTSMEFSWKTDKWHSIARTSPKMTKADGKYVFTGTCAPLKGTDPLTFVEEIKKDGDEVELKWKYDPSHLVSIGHFFAVNLPYADFAGKEIRFNGKAVSVPAATKYGWFKNDGEEQTIEIKYPTGEVLTVESEKKCSVVGVTYLNSGVQVRIMPLTPGKLELSLKLK